MNLQSRYRLERDKIYTYEDDEFYFAYQTVNYEFHILEFYVVPEKRGLLNIYFDKIYDFVKENYPNSLFMVATVIPEVENSERMLMGLLKYKFKLLSAKEDKITMIWEIVWDS